MGHSAFNKGNIGWSGSWNNVLTSPADIQNWETQIELLFAEMERTRSGALLVAAVQHTARKMLIVPDPGTAINASTTATKPSGAYPRGAYSESTGIGSCTRIELTPSNYSVRSGVFSSADTALFHEMCHGLHDVMGRSQAHLNLGGNFDTQDEFWAITLTNIYVSERNYPGLRRDHHGRQPLAANLCDPKAFYHWAPGPIRDMCDSAPHFTRAMAKVPARFNPLKVFYDLYGKQH